MYLKKMSLNNFLRFLYAGLFLLIVSGCSDDASSSGSKDTDIKSTDNTKGSDNVNDTSDTDSNTDNSDSDTVQEKSTDSIQPDICTSDKDCSSTNQLCNLSTHQCVDCLTNDHCDTTTEQCRLGSCVPVQTCKSSKDCSNNTVCDLTKEICVDCVGDNDCDDGYSCFSSLCTLDCASDKECLTFDQVCEPTEAICVDCVTDADCNSTSYCSDFLTCMPMNCTPDSVTCSGKNIVTCDDRGITMDMSECTYGCADGAGSEPAYCTSQSGGKELDFCSSIPKWPGGNQIIDGNPADFGDLPTKEFGFNDSAYTDVTDATVPTNESRATVRVAWSADAIHAHIHVKDANVLRYTNTSLPNTPIEFYDSDNVQIFFAVDNSGTSATDAFQLFMIPPDPAQGALYPDEYSYEGDGYDYYTSSYFVFSYASRIVADGYEVELKATVPTGVTLTSATSVLFDVQVGVKDTTNASTRDFEYAYAYNCTGTCPEGPYYLTSYWCNPTLE